jgi:hypothetical protein
MFTFFRDSVGRRGELQTLAGPPAASHPRGPVSGSSRRERVESGGTRSRVEATTTSPPAFPCAPSGGGSSECVTTRLCSPREDPLSAQPAAFRLAPAATPPAAHQAHFRPAPVGRGHPLRRSACRQQSRACCDRTCHRALTSRRTAASSSPSFMRANPSRRNWRGFASK